MPIFRPDPTKRTKEINHQEWPGGTGVMPLYLSTRPSAKPKRLDPSVAHRALNPLQNANRKDKENGTTRVGKATSLDSSHRLLGSFNNLEGKHHQNECAWQDPYHVALEEDLSHDALVDIVKLAYLRQL